MLTQLNQAFKRIPASNSRIGGEAAQLHRCLFNAILLVVVGVADPQEVLQNSIHFSKDYTDVLLKIHTKN